MRLWIGNPEKLRLIQISRFKRRFSKEIAWFAESTSTRVSICPVFMGNILKDSGEEPLQPGELREIESITIKLKGKK